MIKNIPVLDNKGFAYSPFILTVLILLGLTISAHFTETEARVAEGIYLEIQVNRAVLDMEELKSNVNTLALFYYHEAISGKVNGTKEEIEDSINDNLNKHLQNYMPEEISGIEGNFSVYIETLPDEHLLMKTNKTPRACINKSVILLCSDLGLERRVDVKWNP